MTGKQKNEILNRIKYGMKVSFDTENSPILFDEKVYKIEYAKGDCLKLEGIKELVDAGLVKPYLRKIEDLTENEHETIVQIIKKYGTPITRDNSPLLEYLNKIHADYNNLIASNAAYPATLMMYA